MVDRGDYQAAAAVTQRLVTILRKLLDPGHPAVVFALETQRVIRAKLTRPTERASLSAPTAVPVQFAGNTVLVHVVVNGVQRALLIVDTGDVALGNRIEVTGMYHATWKVIKPTAPYLLK